MLETQFNTVLQTNQMFNGVLQAHKKKSSPVLVSLSIGTIYFTQAYIICKLIHSNNLKRRPEQQLILELQDAYQIYAVSIQAFKSYAKHHINMDTPCHSRGEFNSTGKLVASSTSCPPLCYAAKKIAVT